MRPRTAFSFVTTRAPIFFARSQPAALLMLASGAIVVTSVPFRLRMLSMDIVSSHRVALPPISLICVAVPVSPPLLGGMPWKPFSSTRSLSISYRREAVSRHRGPPNRSVVGKLDRFGSKGDIGAIEPRLHLPPTTDIVRPMALSVFCHQQSLGRAKPVRRSLPPDVKGCRDL